MEKKIFTKNDNGFICKNCGFEVQPLGYSSRNHCPNCLHSLHVDINPGDRANECGGIMEYFHPPGYATSVLAVLVQHSDALPTQHQDGHI